MRTYSTKEFKVVALRESPCPKDMAQVDHPKKAADYWRTHIQPHTNELVETLVALAVNSRRRVMGHVTISQGTMDTVLVHPREVFRPAIVMGASALILMHNHPSGEPAPSEADIKITRDLIRGGQLLKVELLDHVIVGHKDESPNYCSLREMGYFYH